MFYVFDSLHVYMTMLACKYDSDKVSAKMVAAITLQHPEQRSTAILSSQHTNHYTVYALPTEIKLLGLPWTPSAQKASKSEGVCVVV